MENASKALEIAAGVLLAVLIMSLIAYFFSSISEWPEQQDNQKEAEQTAKFNLEYEVYDKKGMYGADVISCLTKAESNNEKYYDGGSFLSGQRYGETYWINVFIKLNSDLEEQIIVYGLESGAAGQYNQVLKFGDVKNQKTGEEYELGNIGFDFKVSANKKQYTFFTETTKLKADVNVLSPDSSDLPAGFNVRDLIDIDIANPIIENSIHYNTWLYDRKLGTTTPDTNSVTPLQILLDTCSTNVKQIVKNPAKDEDSLKAWSTAEWRTALYDFKSRKFRCDNIKYSDTTGRVNEIYFSEI